MSLLSDENFNGNIVRGLLLRQPNLDLLRVQDVGLRKVDDKTYHNKKGKIGLYHTLLKNYASLVGLSLMTDKSRVYTVFIQRCGAVGDPPAEQELQKWVHSQVTKES